MRRKAKAEENTRRFQAINISSAVVGSHIKVQRYLSKVMMSQSFLSIRWHTLDESLRAFRMIAFVLAIMRCGEELGLEFIMLSKKNIRVHVLRLQVSSPVWPFFWP